MFFSIYVYKNSIYLCTNCHVCDGGCSLTAKLPLFTKNYHDFKSTWSFSLSITVHVQNIGTQKNFALLRKS